MEVLKQGGEAIESQIDPHAYVPDWFYGALAVLAARQPDCLASWREAWNVLADQRQRYRFHRNGGGGYAPSAHLIRTCRQLLHLLVERGEDSDARQLWSDLLRFTFDLAYDGRPGRLGISEYEVVVPFAYAPKVFGPDWEMAVKEAGAILASNARLALVAALNLAKNAIDPGAVRSAFDRVGCDMAKALADVQVWRGHEAFTADDLALQNLDEIAKIFNLSYRADSLSHHQVPRPL